MIRVGQWALVFALLSCPLLRGDSLESLSRDVWSWRAQEQPFSSDDIPRIERPAGLQIDWSQTAIANYTSALQQFEKRWSALAPRSTDAVAKQVDYRLLGSVLARVRWELAVEQGWKRNPEFYVDQTLGAMYLVLLPPPPFEEARQAELVTRVRSIPATLRDAQLNLTDMRAPFARLAIASLAGLPDKFQRMQAGLGPHLNRRNAQALAEAVALAIPALEQYRDWLRQRLGSLKPETAIGREQYMHFLRAVALSPYTPEQLLEISRQEWSRAVAFEAYEQARNAGKPSLALFPDQQAQITREQQDEAQVRALLTQQHLLSIPPGMPHYRNLALPSYVEPFEKLGVTDDLTGPSRLQQNGTSYIHVPSPKLGFFALSTARDPRPIIVHEGVPGHYFQLALSWTHPNPIRRHYYDSGANEGIGFYAEEMMLQAGLFDDSPRSREIIYSFMRLRALRVEVDVKLALGEFTLEQAADYLAQTVPMDKGTALEEAAMFASEPGQAITYQIGKVQITNMLADARRKQGASFSLLRFNDFVWLNGNVPISLQRWEMLGDPSDVPALKERVQ
jgi:hypothetical protein